MANKKLKVEVELETSKAKQQLAGMADGAGSSPVDSAAEKTAKALESAAKGAKDLGDSTKSAGVNIQSAVRAFGGLAIGMAGQYSARYLDEGSTARNAVEYGSAALQGASIGMMAGPWGAAAGAVLGLGKTYIDKQGEKEQKLKDFDEYDRRYQSARDWKNRFDEMTYMGKDKSSRADKIQALEEELKKYKGSEAKIVDSIKQFTSKGQYENARHQKTSLEGNRQRQEQLESAIKSMRRDQENAPNEEKTSTQAVDALSRVGGAFAGAGSGDALLRTSREQVELLRSIERKTGGASWQ